MGNNYKLNQLLAWALRDGQVAAVPLPAAVWLMGSALAGLLGFRRTAATLGLR